MPKKLLFNNKYITINPIISLHQDNRGSIINAFGTNTNEDNPTPMHQPRIISTKPGVIRGNHYHPDEEETIIFLNGLWQAKFATKTGELAQETALDCTSNPIVVTIPPEISHAFIYKGTRIGYIFHYSDKPYKINRANPLTLI